MSSLNYEDYLHKIWYDLKHPASFTGPDKLYRIVKKDGKFKIGRHKIRQWLQDQDSYSLSRNTVRKFRRSRYVVNTIDSLWEIDLAQFDSFQSENLGVKYLLFVIDVFSKHLWIESLKDKTHKSVLKALKKILSGSRRPTSIRSDLGKEFVNKYVRGYLSKEGINTYYSQNETKSAVVERSIRSIKTIMYTYFRHKQTYKYIDVIQDMVASYNKRPHRSLGGYTPSEVNKQNADEVRLSAYFARNPSKKKMKRRELKMSKQCHQREKRNQTTASNTELMIWSGLHLNVIRFREGINRNGQKSSLKFDVDITEIVCPLTYSKIC